MNANEAEAPKYGAWRYDYASEQWDFTDHVLKLADVGSADVHDITPLFEAMPIAEEREALRELLDTAIRTRGGMAGQFRLSTLSRGDAVFALVAETVRDADDNPVELRGYSTDVTEEVRQATRAAVDAATRHRRAIEQVKGALMVTYGIDEVTAFALLRQQSNVHNVKLNVLSEHVSRAMAANRQDGRVPMMEMIEQAAAALASERDTGTPDPSTERLVTESPA